MNAPDELWDDRKSITNFHCLHLTSWFPPAIPIALYELKTRKRKKQTNNASSPKTITDATMIKQKQFVTAAVLLFLAVTRNLLPTFEMCRSWKKSQYYEIKISHHGKCKMQCLKDEQGRFTRLKTTRSSRVVLQNVTGSCHATCT